MLNVETPSHEIMASQGAIAIRSIALIQQHKHWHIDFVMPSSYALVMRPRPVGAQVVIKQILTTLWLVVVLLGANLDKHLKAHEEWLMVFVTLSAAMFGMGE